jgi:Ca2+-binding RTX toxin-like protein
MKAIVLALSAAAVLVAPAAAHAATSLELAGSRLDITGDAFANRITVTRANDAFTVEDTLADLTIEAPAPCFLLDDRRARCQLPAATPLRIEGRAGDDILTAGSSVTAPATILGENGADAVRGGAGNDTLLGGRAEDELKGGPGNDLMAGEGGPDRFFGDAGFDTLDYRASGPVFVELPDEGDFTNENGDAGDQTLAGFGQGDRLDSTIENVLGSSFADEIEGNEADNVLRGGGGADELRGEEGDDRLEGGAGPDTLTGGAQLDTATYGERQAAVSVNLADTGAVHGNSDDGPADARDRISGDVEGVQGGAANDLLRGGPGPNVLRGGAGIDVLRGAGGDDELNGEADGDDLDGGDGNDTERGGDGDDTMSPSAGGDFVSGGAGRDTVSYAERSEGLQPVGAEQRVSVRLDGARNDGGLLDGGNVLTSAGGIGGADNVQPDVEVLTGTAEDDLLEGAGAAEVIVGGLGGDVLRGLGGDDRLDGGEGADLLDGGGGEDTSTYLTPLRPVDGLTPQPRAEGVVVRLDGLADDGSAADGPPGARDDVRTENVVGTNLSDVLRGDAGPNDLDGGGGDDTLEGFAGADFLNGGPGLDRLSAGDGDDSLFTNDGAPDNLSCGLDADTAFVDLQDAAIPVDKGVLPLAAECESIFAAPVGELPNVTVKRRARRSGERLTLGLACPRRAARACRGSVVLEDARGRTASARGRFALRRGARGSVSLRLRRGAAGLVAVASERARDGRPKTTRVPLKV